jgi:hypothetical protein
MRSFSAGCEKYHKVRGVQLEHPLGPFGSKGFSPLTLRGPRLTTATSRTSLLPIMPRAAHHHHIHHHGPTGLGERMCMARSC